MAGLFEKDIRLIMHRKQALYMFLAVAVLMAASQEDGGTFVIGYLTMLGCIFTVSTFSYDEFDNGLPFLMTLPIDSKVYVVEKYLLSGMCCAISMVAALVIALAVNIFKGISYSMAELLLSALVIYCVCMILLAVMIPVQLKYGAERSRMVLIAIAGIVAACIGIMMAISKKNQALTEKLAEIAARMDGIPEYMYLFLFLVLGIGAVWISMNISSRIMEHKEY